MKPWYDESGVTLFHGHVLDVLKQLPNESVNACVTSPPYWGLRDYGMAGQIGLEPTPYEYVTVITEIFEEVRRVLRPDGTCWLNLGDSYANDTKWGGSTGGKHADGLHGEAVGRGKRQTGLKAKDLCGIPWRVAFALQEAGWWLRSDIIWAKPAPMPESVMDRPTRSHEYIFLLTKSDKYWYDHEAIKEPSVADYGSGNGFKCDSRLSFLDGDGPRGSDTPWQPKSWNGSKFDGPRDLAIHPNVGRKQRTAAKSSPTVKNSCGAHDAPFGDTRNKRDVWFVNTEPFPGAHFATFPPALILPCVLAGCPEGGIILDPFSGAGTTAMVAKENGRRAIGIDLNEDYLKMSAKRLRQDNLFSLGNSNTQRAESPDPAAEASPSQP